MLIVIIFQIISDFEEMENDTTGKGSSGLEIEAVEPKRKRGRSAEMQELKQVVILENKTRSRSTTIAAPLPTTPAPPTPSHASRPG